jgi:hypothetical protein
MLIILDQKDDLLKNLKKTIFLIFLFQFLNDHKKISKFRSEKSEESGNNKETKIN